MFSKKGGEWPTVMAHQKRIRKLKESSFTDASRLGAKKSRDGLRESLNGEGFSQEDRAGWWDTAKFFDHVLDVAREQDDFHIRLQFNHPSHQLNAVHDRRLVTLL